MQAWTVIDERISSRAQIEEVFDTVTLQHIQFVHFLINQYGPSAVPSSVYEIGLFTSELQNVWPLYSRPSPCYEPYEQLLLRVGCAVFLTSFVYEIRKKWSNSIKFYPAYCILTNFEWK